MHIVAIYNNKGGEGKSTVTVGLAEFLAANRSKKVLVIDLDAQASSSCALVGHKALNAAIGEGRTIVELAAYLRRSRRPKVDLSNYLTRRPASESRGSALKELALLVPDGDRMFDVENSMRWGRHNGLFLEHLKPALHDFDFVLIDLPANVTRASMISINGLAMADFVLVPTRSTRISINALPRTFAMIDKIRDASGNGRPAVLGFLLNATDKRHQQYRSTVKPVVEAAKKGEIPAFFKNHWPPSPALESATDENRETDTLKERFGVVYEHARKVTQELEEACQNHHFQAATPIKRSFWKRHGLA